MFSRRVCPIFPAAGGHATATGYYHEAGQGAEKEKSEADKSQEAKRADVQRFADTHTFTRTTDGVWQIHLGKVIPFRQ